MTAALWPSSSTLALLQMLHERVKAYKKRLYEEHAMNLAHERHILRLHDDIKRLQGLVQVGGHGCFVKKQFWGTWLIAFICLDGLL